MVIDHSVQVDFSGTGQALSKNEALEFERNKERFTFLKWGASAFSNMLIIPPGSGIVHQVINNTCNSLTGLSIYVIFKSISKYFMIYICQYFTGKFGVLSKSMLC